MVACSFDTPMASLFTLKRIFDMNNPKTENTNVMRILKFDQTSYLIRTVTSPAFGEVEVASASLNNELLNAIGSGYISEEARLIDEQIFFYVDDAVLHNADEYLIKYLEEEVLI